MCVCVCLSVCVWSAAAECIQHAESVALRVDSDESNSCIYGHIHHLLQESTR